MSTHSIRLWDPVDGPVTEPGLRARISAMGYAVSRYVYAPGTSFPDHTHGYDKVDAVVSGTLRVGIGGTDIVLRPGDAVMVPRGVVHHAEVLGDEPVVSLDGSKH